MGKFGQNLVNTVQEKCAVPKARPRENVVLPLATNFGQKWK